MLDVKESIILLIHAGANTDIKNKEKLIPLKFAIKPTKELVLQEINTFKLNQVKMQRTLMLKIEQMSKKIENLESEIVNLKNK